MPLEKVTFPTNEKKINTKGRIKQDYDAPALILEDSENDITAYFSIEHGMYAQAEYGNGNYEIFSTKESFISDLISIYKPSYNIDTDDDILRGVMYLGQICEAICKTRIPINVVLDNIDLFEEFVRCTLDFLGYSKEKHNVNLRAALGLLQIEECDQIDGQFIIPCKMANQEIRGFGSLSIFEDRVSICMTKSLSYRLECPYAISRHLDEYSKFKLSTYLLWILLVFTGFYFNEDSLCNDLYSPEENLGNIPYYFGGLYDTPVVDLFDFVKSLKLEKLIKNSRRN